MKVSGHKLVPLFSVTIGRIKFRWPIASPLFFLVAFGFYLIWIGATAGTFVTGDEGYILATVAEPGLVQQVAPYHFGEIMHSLWVLSGKSIVGYRRLTLVAGSLAAGALACALLRHTGLKAARERYGVAFLLGVFAWTSAHFLGFISTGYNQIASIATIIGAYGIVLLFIPLSKNPIRFSSALLGGGMICVASTLMMYSKYSAMAYVLVAIIVFVGMFLVYRKKSGIVTPVWMFVLVGILIAITIIEMQLYLEATAFVQEYIAALGLHERLITRDVLNFLAFLVVFLLGAIAWKRKQRAPQSPFGKWLPVLGVVLTAAAFWSPLFLETGRDVAQARNSTALIYAISPPFAMLLAVSIFYVLGQLGGALVWEARESGETDASLFLVCATLMGAAVFMPVGTSSTFGFELNIFRSMLGWMLLAASFLIYGGWRCSRPALRTLVALCVVGLLLATAHGYARLNAMTGTPFKPRSLAGWVPIPFPDQGSVYLLPQVAADMVAMKEAASSANWRPGTYILDLTGISKGVLFYLGAKPIAHGWYSSVTPERDALAATALALGIIAPDVLRQAWIAKWETPVEGELPPAFLNDFQLGFPGRYTLVGAFRILPGYPRLQIWAPESDPAAERTGHGIAADTK
ncbi:hypothetical protein NAT65_03525 [Achromobacter xylosoxidans]|uniref:hypothetical protein n=1 Tax=Alcaligenes xylosoxydans xylosoxydans TaxID=85698 RepID=UPI00203B457C|nr:hypothetical protein [Achromobacter xylosoxidans]MCM2570136.1 hypothetical protein [Achromobacter xylosoxidans]